MRTVCVPVIRDFDYHGRAVVAGEALDMPAAEALALSRKGVVSLSPARRLQAREIKAEASVEPDDEPKPKRRYRRKDMRAED